MLEPKMNDTASVTVASAGAEIGTVKATEAVAWLHRSLDQAEESGPFATFVDVDVWKASALLARNPGNRPVHQRGLRDLCAAAERGEWQVNGESVIVSDTGELNDGQHRLLTVIKTGLTLRMLVAFGVPRDSRTTVDGAGAGKRSPGNVLVMRGVDGGKNVATGLRALLNLQDGKHLDTARTNREIELAYDATPGFAASVTIGVRTARTFRLGSGPLSALHYLFAKVDRERADDFMVALETGDGLRATHPIALLRTRLMKNMGAKARLPAQEIAALTIKTWNRTMDGAEVTQLRWRTEGPGAEDFPRIAGLKPSA